MRRQWLWRHAPLANIRPEIGFAYVARTGLPELSSHEQPSDARVLEDGVPLPGPANDLHDNIRRVGRGRFSFWYDCVYFSTVDNSDPRANGRQYEIAYPLKLRSMKIGDFLHIRVLLKGGAARAKSGEYQPVNLNIRDSSPDAIKRDVEYAVQISQNLMRWFPEGPLSLTGKRVLEIGPGINFGSAVLMACMGARVMVADRFLAPWEEEYHPEFYAVLRDWVQGNMPQADLSPLNRILSERGYSRNSVACYSTPLEELEGIPDASVDIIFSNAVLEHLADPRAAFRQMARVSKPGALGYHQVDFRDHNDFARPLEYLLIRDRKFAKEFVDRHGERGNRYRPSEYHKLFQAAGFRVQSFTCSCTVDESYLFEFMPRLRQAAGSRYRNLNREDLKQVSGLFCLERL